MVFQPYTIGSYTPHHPWYYALRGFPIPLKQIRVMSRRHTQPGYMQPEIEKAAELSEPARSERLRKMRDEFKRRLETDVQRYRAVRRCLIDRRRTTPDDPEAPDCQTPHTEISILVSHLFNDFLHLELLETHLSKQRDLFS